jgi:hypothetical protein
MNFLGALEALGAVWERFGKFLLITVSKVLALLAADTNRIP